MDRENTAGGLLLPSMVDGRAAWTAPEVQEIADYMHYGYAPFGWEGDERLGLYIDADGRWSVYRLEADGQMRRFCQAKTREQKLDLGLISALVLHDARRGFDPVRFVQEQEQYEAQRLAFGLG